MASQRFAMKQTLMLGFWAKIRTVQLRQQARSHWAGVLFLLAVSFEAQPCADTALPTEFRLLVTSMIRYAINTKRRLRWSAFLHLKL